MCIYQADQAALELYADVQLWEEAIHDKSWFEGLFAVIFLFAFGQAVRGQLLPICVPLAEDNWGAFKNVDMVFADPVNHLDMFNKDIAVGGRSIAKELEAAARLCMARKFHDCGVTLGHAFSSVEEPKD